MGKFFFSSLVFFTAIASVFAVRSADEIAELKFLANQGEISALLELGSCYECGDGVPADKMRALCYYLIAAKSKNKEAEKRISALGFERFLSGYRTPEIAQTTSDEKYTVGLGGGVTMELMKIPSGTFMMGSPSDEKGHENDENQVRVCITKPFYLGKTEVTQAQWKAVMGQNPSYFKGDNLPVEKVSWSDAVKYCEKLTERERRQGRLASGWKFTLPTEAQWEYACRAGTTARFYTGDSESDLSCVGWYNGNSRSKTHPVGQKPPNTFGLYDMHGNVWEWCSDWYASSLCGGDDPAGAASGPNRVIRGGSWDCVPQRCRSAFRRLNSPLNRGTGLGFRVALVQE